MVLNALWVGLKEEEVKVNDRIGGGRKRKEKDEENRVRRKGRGRRDIADRGGEQLGREEKDTSIIL